jgi:hypothetical protein
MSSVVATDFQKPRRYVAQLDCVYGSFAVILAANSVAFGPEDLNVIVKVQCTHTSALLLHSAQYEERVTVSWDLASYNHVEVYRYFGGAHCFHVHGGRAC